MFNKLSLAAKRNADQLWFIGGGICIIGAVAGAWKAAPRYKEIVEEYHDTMDEYNLAIQIADSKDDPESVYPMKKRKADKRGIMLHTAMKHAVNFAKIVVPVLGAFSCFGKGYGVLKGWFNGAMSFAMKKDKELKHLEAAIVATQGKEALKKLKGPGYEEVEVTQVDPETGEEKKTIVREATEPFTFFFDESNPNWEKDPVWNRRFLWQKQNQLNGMLQRRGYVFLNEALDILEIPMVDEGYTFGWVFYDDPKAAKEAGSSNRIDLGILDENERAQAFVNGEERSILLRLNVDKAPIIGKTGFRSIKKLS